MYWCWSGSRSFCGKMLRKIFLALSIQLFILWGPSSFAEVSIDHITLIVKDLDESASRLSQLGFTLKKPHTYKSGEQKGLTTQAIRFSSGQYLQLISFTKRDKNGLGQGLGELGKWYQNILSATEGGATVILKFDEEEQIQKTAGLFKEAQIPSKLIKNQGHDWLSFKTKGPYSNLSFIFYRDPPRIQPQLVDHQNKVVGIQKVLINAPGDPFSWAKILKLSKADQVGLQFVETDRFRDPLLFIREVILEGPPSKKPLIFTIGKTKFFLN